MPSVFCGSAGHVMNVVEMFVDMISSTDDWMSLSVMRLMCPFMTFLSQICSGLEPMEYLQPAEEPIEEPGSSARGGLHRPLRGSGGRYHRTPAAARLMAFQIGDQPMWGRRCCYGHALAPCSRQCRGARALLCRSGRRTG